jgi:hypothetical protein
MPEADELVTYALNLQQEVIARAEAADDGALRPSTLTELLLEHLAEIGEADDSTACSIEGRGIRCSGYFLSEDGDRLDLFVTIAVMTGRPDPVSKTDIDTALRRLTTFLHQAMDAPPRGAEEALDRFEVASAIWNSRNELSHIRLFVLTDGLVRVEKLEAEPVHGIEVSHHVWDLRRFYRASSSGSGHEPVHVDFRTLQARPAPFVSASPPEAGYRCLIGMLSGPTLVELYRDHGPRLLERNVRSFLQLKGKVNQSIRRTIIDAPSMFLAFNNGLSITASGLVTEDGEDGTVRLLAADDFQIVNGGQTTGSLFRAATKDKAPLEGVFVPVKITEILPGADVNDVAARISQSANNQNKVNMADFTANHPFHRAMEELSRTIWAPPPPGLQKQTRWFYERARGQYNDALGRARTQAERKAFEVTHPRRQVFTKTDLAKFEHTWSQFPHIVSRGAQKCYLHFMDVLDQRGAFTPDEPYFQRVVARGILFRETERIVSRQKFGGYRANIVTYTLAWLSHQTAKRVDLNAIWAAQGITPTLATAIESICVAAHDHITSPPGGQNVTEWCKKEACWEAFRKVALPLPAALEGELINREQAERVRSGHAVEEVQTEAELKKAEAVSAVPADTWFEIAAWAKDTQSLAPWERSLAFSLGKLAKAERTPSRKQADHGARILEEARSLGFRG